MSKVQELVNKGRDKKVLPEIFGRRSLSLTELVFFIIAILVLWQGGKLHLTGNVKLAVALLIIFLGMVIG